jgi:hypothetical protein
MKCDDIVVSKVCFQTQLVYRYATVSAVFFATRRRMNLDDLGVVGGAVYKLRIQLTHVACESARFQPSRTYEI